MRLVVDHVVCCSLALAILTAALNPVGASAQGACQPVITIDSPAANATVQGSATLSGWAVDQAAASGSQTGIQDVVVYQDGHANAGGLLLGRATKVARPDVDAALGLRGGQAGWTLNADFSAVSGGTHGLYVSALTACGWSTATITSITIRRAPAEVNVD